MTNGIDITMQTLARSRNQAANKLLEDALRSSMPSVCQAAGKYIIQKGGKSTLEVIRNYTPDDTLYTNIIQENREKFIPALKLAVQGEDADLAHNALMIIRMLRFYEILPFLINIFMDQGKKEEDLDNIAGTLRKLLDKFVEALEERKNRRAMYGTVLPEVLDVVSKGVTGYHKNDPDLILLVFCRLYPYLTENYKSLAQFLRNPSLKTYQSIFHLIQQKQDAAVYELIFYCLNLPNPPQMIVSAFTKRSDSSFISAFLKMLPDTFSEVFEANIVQMVVPKWAGNIKETLEHLDEKAQQGLAGLLEILNLSTPEIIAAQQLIFTHGKGKGRLAALHTLSHHSGSLIDKVFWDACGDTDPDVQVFALSQLASRKVQNMSVRLLQFAGSPHEKVREMVQELLPNFRFNRFIETFDLMTEEQRKMMFKLVRAMDTETVSALGRMLLFGSANERSKAMQCVDYGQMTPLLEDVLCTVLEEEQSPPLRIQAAELLVSGKREQSRSALVQTMHRDADSAVRAAAKKALETRPVAWKVNH